jgi:sarcosine oxidase subunit gamma
MSAPILERCRQKVRLGLKGPGAAEWLAAQGFVLPAAPNTWVHSEQSTSEDALLVARLGQSEFFLEEGAAGATLRRLSPSLNQRLPGVYPVLREDWGFTLGGARVHDVLAQVCNVNFGALPPDSHLVIMTLMIGVAVLVVPQGGAGGHGAAGHGAAGQGAGERRYRIWCDPTYGEYFAASLGAVVSECGGGYTGVSG